MTVKKGQEVAISLTAEQEAELRAEYPAEQSFTRILLPRLGMYSQDKTEGKGKAMKVVAEAGTFFTEHQSDEVDEETGKKVWDKKELGSEIDAIILFQRKQLRFYDESDKTYTSSPIYDSNDEEIPLFKNKVKIATDTPDNLKKMFPGVSKKTGKEKSNLQEDRILYVLYGQDIYQMNLHGTSMYSFLDYARKLNPLAPSMVVTTMNSEPKENGSTQWNQMTFKNARRISAEEGHVVLEKVRQIKEGIAAEKAYYNAGAAADNGEAAANEQFKQLGN